jgi:ABC-type branched-subunit amino acid transport system substrate-binding protein
MSARPLAIGILRDHAGAGGDAFARIVRQACDEVRAARRVATPLEVVEAQADGLPRGSAAAVEAAFARLEARGVVVVIGPAISDNGLLVRDLADAARLPCINWTGGEQTRSEWMFQYQVGSLEEEPGFLALHLAEQEVRRVALVDDRSLVGRRYAEFFLEAAARFGIEVRCHAHAPEGAGFARVATELRAAGGDVVFLGLWYAARELALAIRASGWRPRVFANSALMYGHASADWRRAWEDWIYVDAYSDANPVLRDARSRLGGTGALAPVTVAAAYDMGRLVAEGVASAPEPTRAGVKLGLERIKLVPAALGAAGTTMGFGPWERAALKGRFLVLRAWRGGESIEVGGTPSCAGGSR